MLIPRRGTQRVQAFLYLFAPSAEDTTMRRDDLQQAAMFSYIGCLKNVGLLQTTWYHAVARIGWIFIFAAAVYDVVHRWTRAAVT